MKNKEIIAGFLSNGLACGIKTSNKKNDLGIIFATEPNTRIAGVFTQNKIKAAPVRWCQQNLKSGKGRGRLIVVNSGNANAATGKKGIADNALIARSAAELFGVSSNETFVCSTGKIGAKLPTQKILNGLKHHVGKLTPNGLDKFTSAIVTTDAYSKTAQAQFKIGGKIVSMTAMAKGAGMIEPNMATMLCFVLTDLNISAALLQKLLSEAVGPTLNSLTVDGDTSTNDTVLMMASGLAENTLINKRDPGYALALKTLKNVLGKIAELIALDGEGATKCMVIQVKGAKSRQDADKIARAIGNSQLVKTAMFGNDPNWGRILAAAGYSGANIEEGRIKIALDNITLFAGGRPFDKNENRASAYLKANKMIAVNVDLAIGKHEARILASDLGYEYVRINADYRT